MAPLNPSELADFERDGYVIIRGLLDAEETDLVLGHARQDESLQQATYGRKDASGRETKLALWNRAGDDLYSLVARSPRVVDRMERFLGGEVYLYHFSRSCRKSPWSAAPGSGTRITATGTTMAACSPPWPAA